jgi:hypothetical protein
VIPFQELPSLAYAPDGMMELINQSAKVREVLTTVAREGTMQARDLNFDTIKSIDLSTESKATTFSTFIMAVVSGDIATAESQITDDIEWGLMPYNKVLKGKDQVIPWLKAAGADQKKPIVISNAATKDWGVFEYWNIGTRL